MGISEAEKYIRDLHKKQRNPFLWPDFLTGLPDKAAIIKRIDEVYPHLGEFSIAYIKIAHIQSYLLRYGADKHAEIIQWAAAIIKTTADRCSDAFVGTFGTHSFVVICRKEKMPDFLESMRKIFSKKVSQYYSIKHIKKGLPLTFIGNDGQKVNGGLMKLIAVVADKKLQVKKSHLVRNMVRLCDVVEMTEDEIVVMSNDKIVKE
jgi:GGDEF domain-containing protein